MINHRQFFVRFDFLLLPARIKNSNIFNVFINQKRSARLRNETISKIKLLPAGLSVLKSQQGIAVRFFYWNGSSLNL